MVNKALGFRTCQMYMGLFYVKGSTGHLVYRSMTAREMNMVFITLMFMYN